MDRTAESLPEWKDPDRRADALLRLAAVVDAAPLIPERDIGRVKFMAEAKTIERTRRRRSA